MHAPSRLAGSFRDPSGYVFRHEGFIYRWVAREYAETYLALERSGLFAELFERGWLAPHEEVSLPHCQEAFKVIRPQQIPLISYPYEWCFGQLKAAALLTLDIQIAAMARGFSLKDASNYNIQFVGAFPMLIDTLSFEPYVPGRPWIAYRQFCQHFLAPLLLVHYRDVRFLKHLSTDVQGIPLDLASKLLPWTSLMNLSVLSHIHLHVQTGARASGRDDSRNSKAHVSEAGLTGILENLRGLVRRLKWEPSASTWRDYYSATNYSDESMRHKQQIIEQTIDAFPSKPTLALDFGGNTGRYSRLFSARKTYVATLDVDVSCVEISYRQTQKESDRLVLPMVLDLANPSPAIGWANRERETLEQRVAGGAGAVMALALIHHLVISLNIPMRGVAEYFSKFASRLIIEWVPASDSQVQRLLASRILPPDYTEDSFREAMGQFFPRHTATRIYGSERSIYFYEA